MNRITKGVGLGAAALAALLVLTTPAGAAPNKCKAGKNKCVSKKMQGLLKCHIAAEKDGVSVSSPDIQECLGKPAIKFDGTCDGGTNVDQICLRDNDCPGSTCEGGCFRKLELKDTNGPGPITLDTDCYTFGDSPAFEAKVDAFVDDVVQELDPGYPTVITNSCSAGKKKCVLKKTAGILKCYEKADKAGTAVDPLCIAKAQFKYDGVTGAGALGKTPDATKGCFAKLEAKQDITDSTTICPTTQDYGALEDSVDNFVNDVLEELLALAKPINSQRCTGDTRKGCAVTADCSGVGGTCEFWFGSNLPLSAGGVDTCVTNQFNGTISGTANVDTGSSAGTANLISRVYSGAAAGSPCPQCIGDATVNDGVRGGTCNAGAHSGATCDSNGVSGLRVFGETSLDCGPLPGAILASLPIDLTNTSGTRTKTLSAASPNCRATGHTSQKCFCDTCNNLGATPCSTNADCGAGICGGKRCLGGGNAGTPCTVSGDCLSAVCSVPGLATAPNQCDDDTCSGVPGNNEGQCAAGPFDQFCGPHARYVGCFTDGDCTFPGDTCSIGKNRPCYTDNGTIGASVTSTGVADVPVNHEANDVLASLFCIGPTSSAAVNAAAGLPGLGRLALRGHSFENGTPSTCPTQVNFDPDTGGLGVLDSGWNGNGHNASVLSRGLVTVSFTSCAGTAPTCGVCTYAGPIPNPGAAPVP
jgi:hypothetical protein